MIDINNIPGYKASYAGILRILCWTAFFLALASHFLPPITENGPFIANTKGTHIRPVVTIPEDPRFIRDDLPALKGFNIAWIGDSTSAIYPPDKTIPDANYEEVKLVPAHVLGLLEKLASRKDINIDLNLQPGARSVESFSAVAAAIQSKPDLIVLSFNPVWTFEGYEIHKRQAHLNRASALWAHYTESWPWLALLASPANNLWALAAQPFKILRQSTLYKSYFTGLMPDFTKSRLPVRDMDKLQHMRSGLVFWVCIGKMGNDCPKVMQPNNTDLDNKLWYRELFKLEDVDGEGFTWWAWRNKLAILRQSGIPTLIFDEPLGDDIKQDPEAYENLKRIQDILKDFRQKYNGTNIHIIDRIPEDIVKSATFRSDDSIHMVTEGKFDDYLAQQIWLMMKGTKP